MCQKSKISYAPLLILWFGSQGFQNDQKLKINPCLGGYEWHLCYMLNLCSKRQIQKSSCSKILLVMHHLTRAWEMKRTLICKNNNVWATLQCHRSYKLLKALFYIISFIIKGAFFFQPLVWFWGALKFVSSWPKNSM